MRIDPVPEGSIYFWMYTQGLRGCDPVEVAGVLEQAGKAIRGKDWVNFWNGRNNHEGYLPNTTTKKLFEFGTGTTSNSRKYFKRDFGMYPDLTTAPDMVVDRWVPTDGHGRPLCSWKDKAMSMADAMNSPGRVYLSENNLDCHRVIFDIDGDHGQHIDAPLLKHMDKYRSLTRCITRPGDYVVSYHLEFICDRVIPTMHFPSAHVDILGNEKNVLRCLKNKESNHLSAIPMTIDIWNDIREYIQFKERNELCQY